MTTFKGEEAFAFQRRTLNFSFDLQIQQPGGGGGVDRDLINGLPQVRVVQLHRDNEKGLGFTVTEAGQGGVVNVALITPGGPAEKVKRMYVLQFCVPVSWSHAQTPLSRQRFMTILWLWKLSFACLNNLVTR